MADISAQAFREAAEEYAYLRDGHLDKLLIAAAEQREQWEAERLVVDVITEQQRQQIATLTAERDEFKAKFDRCFEAFEARLKERDEARAAALAQAAAVAEEYDTFVAARIREL